MKTVVITGSARGLGLEMAKVFKKNNITYTLLSYTDTTNGLKTPIGKEYFVNTYSKDKVEEDIKKVRENVDLLMVSMHFGDEYSHTPSNIQM